MGSPGPHLIKAASKAWTNFLSACGVVVKLNFFEARQASGKVIFRWSHMIASGHRVGRMWWTYRCHMVSLSYWRIGLKIRKDCRLNNLQDSWMNMNSKNVFLTVTIGPIPIVASPYQEPVTYLRACIGGLSISLASFTPTINCSCALRPVNNISWTGRSCPSCKNSASIGAVLSPASHNLDASWRYQDCWHWTNQGSGNRYDRWLKIG